MEGIFSYKGGSQVDTPGSSFSPLLYDSVYVRTTASDKVGIQWMNEGVLLGGRMINTNAGLICWLDVKPGFRFNLSNHECTEITNDFPASPRPLTKNQAYSSRWDHNTGTYFLYYKMTQSGQPSIYFFDTLRYIGPIQ
jgi:hypothetical protein